MSPTQAPPVTSMPANGSWVTAVEPTVAAVRTPPAVPSTRPPSPAGVAGYARRGPVRGAGAGAPSPGGGPGAGAACGAGGGSPAIGSVAMPPSSLTCSVHAEPSQ